MIQYVNWISLAVGCVQGFVGFPFCVSLVPVFVQLILGVKETPKYAAIIAKIMVFTFLVLTFFSVGGYWLSVIADGSTSHQESGIYWRVGLFIGFVAWALVVGTVKRRGVGK